MAAKKTNAGSPPLKSPDSKPPTGTAGGTREGSGSDADTRNEEAREPRFRIVGIGASAGGLEALTEFLQELHTGSGMAFVVLSHLDPEHKSALVEILARVSAMPVQEAKDGMTVLPDHVYVLPPNREMVIARRVLLLRPRVDSHQPQMPVDTFLHSLSRDCGSDAIGVILSGTGTDGTLGLKAIRVAGGLTFAQDETARFGGMPGSATAAGAVDFVLPPAQIAAELLWITKQVPAPVIQEVLPSEETAEQDVFVQILRFLSNSSGVDFFHYKRSTLRRRIERRMVLRRLPTLTDYLRCLRNDDEERRLLFEEVLIPVTSFFREPESYEVLKSTILPRLLTNRSHRAPLRIWVAGCASGEEAYSIAICLLEFLDSAPETVPIKIFATDISERAIEVARAGIYGAGISAEVSLQRLQRFFLKTDRGYEINKSVRDMCIFARHDLTRDPPFSQLDLVSCRNLLIYLGPILQDRVLPILHYSLNPGGILMLGGSETVGRFTDLFEVVDRKHKIYARADSPSRLTFEYTPGSPLRAGVVGEAGRERGRSFQEVSRETDRVILGRYAPSGVVVDENLHVLQYRGDTGLYLKSPPGPPTTELLLLAREGLLGDLRDTIERARRDKAPAHQDGVRVKSNDHFTDIALEVIPLADPVSGFGHFVVLFVESSRDEGQGPLPRPRQPLTPEEESEKDREISRLNQDLSATRAYLQSVIEQKEATNEELRAANEEVVSANEELQSTNEELTTAKEELQATNEELTTVNDELQNRIRNTNQLADDMVNLIEATRIPIVVLGPDLCIRRFTPAARAVMNLRSSDIGRPFPELKTKLKAPDLEQLIHNVLDTLETKQGEILDETGTWHKLYIRPYRTLDHKIGGVVLTLIDIDVLKRREREIQESRSYAVSIVETVREPLLVLDGDLRVRTANHSFYVNFGVAAAETEGRLVYELGNGQWNIPRLRTLLEEILPLNGHFEDFEVTHLFPTIGERTMLLNAHRMRDAHEQFILLAIEDITVRKQAEGLRQESEDRLRIMLDTAVDAIITTDDMGTISSINSAAERMFGYGADELIGHNATMLMPSPYKDEHDGYLEHYRRTKEKHLIGIGREVRGRRKDGATFPLDLAVSEFVEHGKAGYTAILRDLSVRKTLEAEVLEVATMEQQRIGQELHDTSAQELTALGLLAEALGETLKKSSPTEAQIAIKILEGVQRVLGQVRDISQGLIRVEVDPEGLSAALTELAAQTTERHGVKCTYECPEPVSVEDNQTATQLYCIAREGVSNAVKHSQARNITIRLETHDHSMTLRVQDDGIGFAKPSPDSSGMGLKIMRYRADLINAHLSIEPTEPVGITVSCTCNKRPNGRGSTRSRTGNSTSLG